MQPDLTEFATREELGRYAEELARHGGDLDRYAADLARYGEELVRYKNELTGSLDAQKNELTTYLNVSIAAEKNERISYVDTRINAEKYDLCEFYSFRNPVLRPGFLQAKGDLLANASTTYPQAWAFLQTTEGHKLCITEAAWQSMSQATRAALADGRTVGWNGIGGVPFFVLDTGVGSLRLPDLRGMYAEAAGFDGLEAGGVHGDGIRNIHGAISHITANTNHSGSATQDALFWSNTNNTHHAVSAPGTGVGSDIVLNARRYVSTANKNQPRAWGRWPACTSGFPRPNGRGWHGTGNVRHSRPV